MLRTARNHTCLFTAILAITAFATVFGQSFTIVNKSGGPVYIYDFDTNPPLQQTTPVSGGNPLAFPGTLSVAMQTPSGVDGRRIYFASAPLNLSLNGSVFPAPTEPDPFNPSFDGNVMFSIAEYLYEPADNRYTVDISYIDAFSFPITIKFSNTGSYTGCVQNFTYGFKNFAAVTNALVKQSTRSRPWKNLVWPVNNARNPAGVQWSNGIYRVIGPNTVWTSDSFGMTTYAPNPYQAFVRILPWNGTQLFSPDTNFNAWQFSVTDPETSGYVKALHKASTPDTNGMYGYFTYPLDEVSGQFTWVPDTANCTLTVYPYSSGKSGW